MLPHSDEMPRRLRQCRLDNSRDAADDLLIIGDFALESMTREEGGDVARLFVERTGRASPFVTRESRPRGVAGQP